MTLLKKTLLLSLIFFISCKTAPHSSRTKAQSKRHYSVKKKRTTTDRTKKTKDLTIRDQIVTEAKKYKGIPYNYGGKTLRSGFDCSGFSTFVFNSKGIDIQGSSSQLAKLGKPKSFNSIEKGDLAFFGNKGKITHVAIVVSKGAEEFKVIHSTSSKGVVISDVHHSKYWKSRFLYAKDIITNFQYGISGLDN